MVSRFVLGLREEIKEVVILHPVAYLADAIALITTIEENTDPKPLKTFQRRQLGKRQQQPYRRISMNQIGANQQSKKEEVPPKPPNNKGAENNTPRRNPNPYQRATLGKCFRCGQQGHLSHECPQQRTPAIHEKETFDEDNIDDLAYIQPDNGDQLSCVL